MRASCWNKFHEFYLDKGLFSRKQINVLDGTIKFVVCFTPLNWTKSNIKHWALM